jgi:hypothetical protein
MVEELLKETLQQYLHGVKHTPSGWNKRNCPMCVTRGHKPDTRERFGIYYSTDGAIALNCFNCGFSTSWQNGRTLSRKFIQLLQTIGVPQADVDKLKFEAFRQKHNIEARNEIKLKGSITKKWVKKDFLPDCYSIRTWLENDCTDKDFLQVANYALERRILDIDKMYWTPHREFFYNKRLVIPFFYKDEIVGWTGRISHNVEKSIPKYYTDMPPSFIYGLDDQRDYDKKYVIINEGVLDAIVTDGIAVLHNDINKDQAAIINALPGQKILCPDRDRSGEELVEIAIENKWAVAFPNWGKDRKGHVIKDASSAVEIYGHLLTIKSIIDTAETDSFAIRTKRKMDSLTYG